MTPKLSLLTSCLLRRKMKRSPKKLCYNLAWRAPMSRRNSYLVWEELSRGLTIPAGIIAIIDEVIE